MRFFSGFIRALAALAFAAGANISWSQTVAMPPPHDPNDYPDFGYHVDEGWAKLPGRKWGGISAVDIDLDGKSVWVLDRCEGANGECGKSSLPPVLQFDSTGKLVRSWGVNMFRYPHGIYADPKGFIWTADGISNDGIAGQVVRKWTRDGKLVQTMGEWGVAGTDAAHFNGVSDMLIAPDGSLFIADGHNDKTNNRILKFGKDGKFIKSWGKLGTGPGEFNPPHGLAMDKAGRLYVADRSNNRIQIFDQEGNFLAEWKQFGRPSGIVITKDDMIYVSDSQSGDKNNPGYRMGIRWGRIADGKVIGFIPWEEYNTIEGLAVDKAGNIYAGFTNTMNFRKFSRK